MFNVTKNKLWLLLLPIVLIIAGVVGFFEQRLQGRYRLCGRYVHAD